MGLFKQKTEQADNTSATSSEGQSDRSSSLTQQNQAWAYSIIRSPRITEKTYRLFQNNTYTFEVDKRANKRQIKKAVELLFEVPVTSVRIINVKPRQVMFQQRRGTTAAMKKAIVSVAQGYSISL